MATANNRVEHPDYYQGENGIETIEIIRHYVCDIANALKYLMRAGKKSEMGMADAEKEIEDLKKALWYIEDYFNEDVIRYEHNSSIDYSLAMVEAATGYKPCKIIEGYEARVSDAILSLLPVGIQFNGQDFSCDTWRENLSEATKSIQQRIADIKNNIKN